MDATCYNCDDLTPHTQNPCGEEKTGGSDGAVLFSCDHTTTDYTNDTQIQADITAGKAVVVKNAIIDIPAASPTKQPTNLGGCGSDVITTYDRTANITDGYMNEENIDMWNIIFAGRKLGAILINQCGDTTNPQSVLITGSITAEGSPIFPGRNDAFQRFEGIFNWKSKTSPTLVNTPPNIFD